MLRQHGSWCIRWSVGPGPAVRPGGSDLADDASEERTGLCSFRVDALSKSPLVPPRLLGSSRGPITSDHSVAGWRPLSGCLHRPTVRHGPEGLAALQASLRSDDPDCPPLESNLGTLPTAPRLQTDSSQTVCLAFSVPFYGVRGVSLIFHLSPFTPRWLRPF